MAQVKYLTYAGITLPLSTPALEGRMATLLPFTDFDGWDAWQFAGYDLQKLPTPSWPRIPQLEPGVLYWPTGATRPAWFHAVVDDDRLKQIRTAIGDPMTPQPLVMADGRKDSQITAQMYMLPPRPINQLDSSKGWLLTLTDVRFYWHWRVGSISDTPESWGDLYDQVGGILGVDIDVDDIPEAYQFPSSKWTGYVRPPATLLDAVAAQVGQRVVVDLDGSVSTVNWQTARDHHNAQVENMSLVAGGFLDDTDIARYVPSALATAFADWSDAGSGAECQGVVKPYITTSLLGLLGVDGYGTASGVTDATGLIYADFSYTGATGSDSGSAVQCQALADQAAGDWYGWKLSDDDLAFPGITPWEPSGWEDTIEWIQRIEGSGPVLLTRLRRGHWDQFPSGTFSGDPPDSGVPQGNTVQKVKLTGVGVGVDGGTAWAADIWEESEGATAPDFGPLGGIPLGGPGNPYCLYATQAVTGMSGNPGIGDVYTATPNPRNPCKTWLFTPKLTTGDCAGAWYAGMAVTAAVQMIQLSGDGRCNCIPDEGDDPSGTQLALYVASQGGWVRTTMGKTCCGCGMMVFRILDPVAGTAEVQILGDHVACDGSGVFDETLHLDCTGLDPDGVPFAIFFADDKKACANEDPTGCFNRFRIKVRCDSPPSNNCTCQWCTSCCSGASPYGWYGIFTGFTDAAMNGDWVYPFDSTGASGCRYAASCPNPSSSSGSGSAYNSVLDVVGSGTSWNWQLNHNGAIYQAGVGTPCCSDMILAKVSGDGPSTIALSPILANGECPTCDKDWPDTLYVKILSVTATGGATPQFAAGTVIPITKVPMSTTPDSDAPWNPKYICGGWGSGGERGCLLPPFPSVCFGCQTDSQSDCTTAYVAPGCTAFTVVAVGPDGSPAFAVGVSTSPDYSGVEFTSCDCSGTLLVGTSTVTCEGCSWGPSGSTLTYTVQVTDTEP